jgi:dTDP-4-amino-4,6-dideoxygalactose transaminase
LLAVGCGEGDEVLVPSLNFVAAANTIGQTGARPVFCDIAGADDLTVSPADLEAAVGPATRALLVMHYGGHPCRMEPILDLAKKHGLAVIEDAAHAPGGTWRGRMCGTIGDVGCFSFFSNKNLPIGEGGMVVTNDDDVAGRIELLRSHGMTTLTWARHQGHASSYDVLTPGFNYRLDEVRASMGLVQLARLDRGNEARAAISGRYRDELDGVDGIRMPFGEHDDSASAHHLAVLVLPEAREREPLRVHLKDRGVQTSVHYPPIHRFAAYSHGPVRPLPVTDDVGDRLVTLPLYPHVDESQISLVIDGVRDFATRRVRG